MKDASSVVQNYFICCFQYCKNTTMKVPQTQVYLFEKNIITVQYLPKCGSMLFTRTVSGFQKRLLGRLRVSIPPYSAGSHVNLSSVQACLSQTKVCNTWRPSRSREAHLVLVLAHNAKQTIM